MDACFGLRALRGVKRGHDYVALDQDAPQKQVLHSREGCKRHRIGSRLRLHGHGNA